MNGPFIAKFAMNGPFIASGMGVTAADLMTGPLTTAR